MADWFVFGLAAVAGYLFWHTPIAGKFVSGIAAALATWIGRNTVIFNGGSFSNGEVLFGAISVALVSGLFLMIEQAESSGRRKSKITSLDERARNNKQDSSLASESRSTMDVVEQNSPEVSSAQRSRKCSTSKQNSLRQETGDQKLEAPSAEGRIDRRGRSAFEHSDRSLRQPLEEIKTDILNNPESNLEGFCETIADLSGHDLTQLQGKAADERKGNKAETNFERELLSLAKLTRQQEGAMLAVQFLALYLDALRASDWDFRVIFYMRDIISSAVKNSPTKTIALLDLELDKYDLDVLGLNSYKPQNL